MRVYLDYNATAPIRPRVASAVEPWIFPGPDSGQYGNASSIHWAGREAKKHLEAARTKVAELTDRRPSEVIFTSGGTESDNLALRAVLARGEGEPPARLITSAVEHPAILEPARALASAGVDVERVPVDARGRLDFGALERALETPARLVSIMAVNNETGVVFPADDVIALAHERGAWVHIDAVQGAGRVPLPLDADLVTISGHKLGGLKGSGVLLTKKHVRIPPAMLGGAQERGLRAGTEPIAQAVALAEALQAALEEQAEETVRLSALRARIDRLLERIEGVTILGRDADRVSQTTTAVFDGVEGEALLHALDLEGIAASSGSACASGSLEPSHVLLEMGLSPASALSAVRFSMGWATHPRDVDHLERVLFGAVEQVRAAAESDADQEN